MEVIKNGKLGISFKTNDENDLQNKIIKFLNKRFKLDNKIRIQHLMNYTELESNQKYLKTLKSKGILIISHNKKILDICDKIYNLEIKKYIK